LSEGQFQRTYVLIQFGHNDQPGKAERSTTLPEFTDNLQRYVQEVRAKGAVAVLVTPLTRRQFKDGKVIRGLEDWAQAAREVAHASRTPLLDLHADSVAAVEAAGPTLANAFAPGPPSAEVAAAALTGTTIEFIKPAQPDPDRPSFDYTHLGPSGAAFFADMVAKEIRDALPELAPLIAD
jgi:lysophospholipase L1-like esterase